MYKQGKTMGKKFETSTIKHKLTVTLMSVSLVALAGCSSQSKITNLEPVSTGGGYQAEYRTRGVLDPRIIPASANINADKCAPEAAVSPLPVSFLTNELLSPNDLVEVNISNDEAFSGKYEVSGDGTLKIKNLISVPAFGRSVVQVEADVIQALKVGKFYNSVPTVSVRLADYGGVRVFVSGAVFEPGQVTIGGSAISNNNDNAREQAIGAATVGRRISHSLQSAGGVRPDADLSRVEIKRGSQRFIIDLRQALIGGVFDDRVLLEGDQISVPSRGCFQSGLVKPSSVSPPGAMVFMSNLTEPALSNANSAINKDTRSLRYGTRMLQALVGMNCVGGSKTTNAHRSAVLYSRNPATGTSIVIERNIEELVRNGDRDEYDPYILPNDALACYDSGTTNIAKLAQSFGIVAGAVVLGRGL